MIKRATAERYIQLLCDRATTVNSGPYAYHIERLEVFGSYLSDKNPIGDLDVMVTMRLRETTDTHDIDSMLESRRKAADISGKTFPSFLDRIVWPTEEVHRILRQHNYGISIHDSSERPYLTGDFWEFYVMPHNDMTKQIG